jgi:crotonobetainyl-CoA:carnitine CoA-transferase CaiB-like acyl-CoA transferase
MVRLIGKDSWAADNKFATKAGRKQYRHELEQRLAEWNKGLTPRLAFRLLQKAGVPAEIPMSGEDLYYDIHLRARQHIVETEAAPWGKITPPWPAGYSVSLIGGRRSTCAVDRCTERLRLWPDPWTESRRDNRREE